MNEIQSSEDRDVMTAIEGNVENNQNNKLISKIWEIFDILTGESSLVIYLFIHWIITCSMHISWSENAFSSFITFAYFISILFAFMSIATRLNTFLIPIFIISNCATMIIFTIIFYNIFLDSLNEKWKICEKPLFHIFCNALQFENFYSSYFLSFSMLIFFSLTIMSIANQFARNKQIFQQQIVQENRVYYYPNVRILPSEHIVGPIEQDEPPRYSVLENAGQISMPTVNPSVRNEPSQQESMRSMTSPPRYSYWERTFGRPLSLHDLTTKSVVEKN